MQKNQAKIMILAPGRSGSTSLLKVLDCHPAIKGLEEPFHKVGGKERVGHEYYIRFVHDADSFYSTVDQIFKDYNCIKHMMHDVPVAYHQGVFKRNDLRIIFLYRKNTLRKSMSQFISRQTAVWAGGDQSKSKIFNHTFEHIPVRKIKKRMERQLARESDYRGMLDDLGVEYFDLPHENLYGERKDFQCRTRVVEEILDFCGYDKEALFQEPMMSRVKAWLEPKMKLNSEDSYRLIPNIDEIEEQCGSDKTGYLFR